MKKIIVVSVFVLAFSLFVPRISLAQPACGREGDVCTSPGSQSSCCTGYTCEATGFGATNTGVCSFKEKDESLVGGSGQACKPGNECDEGLVCSPGNICISPKTIETTTSNSTSSAPDSVLCKNGTGINTAIGCIPINDSSAFVSFILKWAIGVGGGIAFLLILLSGFQIMTSSGNPERLKAGQELLTSAVAGLILLIFSVFILKIIGVDILGLPGFGG